MTELGKLIEAASRANGMRSMQAAADLATELGAPISKSHISKNARAIDTVTPQLIRGIAKGYGIQEADVARAVLADLGITIPDYSPSPESAIRRDPNLSSEARAMLLAAIQAARSPARDVPVARGDQLQNPSWGPTYVAADGPRVSGDQDGDQRHNLAGG